MKLILSGKGPGKTVIASLLAVTHAIGVYDADPYRALTELFPGAEPYDKDGIIAPCIIDTALVDERGRPYYHILKENPDGWVIVVTSPHTHEVASTKRMIEDMKEFANAHIQGVIISMASGEEEAEKIAHKLGVSLIGWTPLSNDIENCLYTGEPVTYEDMDRRMETQIIKIGEKLKLQRKGGKINKKKRGLFQR